MDEKKLQTRFDNCIKSLMKHEGTTYSCKYDLVKGKLVGDNGKTFTVVLTVYAKMCAEWGRVLNIIRISITPEHQGGFTCLMKMIQGRPNFAENVDHIEIECLFNTHTQDRLIACGWTQQYGNYYCKV